MADRAMPLGIIVERRRSGHPWQDHVWLPVAVTADVVDGDNWRVLRDLGDRVHYFAGTLPLELFRGECDGYRSNLAQDPPRIFVVMRPGEDADDADMEPFLVTACPYEALGYTESGDEIVEGVAMPGEVLAMVRQFVEEFHVEEPFKKRKNTRNGARPAYTRPRGRRSAESG